MANLISITKSKILIIDGIAKSILGRAHFTEDLIIMKAVSRRPKDYEDIRGIVSIHKNLDKERIKYWVCQFGAILEIPEIWDNLKKNLY